MDLKRTRAWAHGFTLLEVLVCLGIIGVLLAILLPALSGVWGTAQTLQSQSNLRNLYIGMMLYVEGEQSYPCIVAGELYPDIDGTSFSPTYWEVENVWHGIIYPYFPHDEALEVFFSPGLDRFSARAFPSYAYSHSFVGDPVIWSGRDLSGTTDTSRLEQPARAGSVRFPSAKVILWDRALGFELDPIETDDIGNIAQATPVGFDDGSVHVRVPAEATAGVANPLHARISARVNLHNTPDGVQGRDY
jgi:prepilin-type N-terminal cleavage/methylation domain-containing protein